jgi:predicted enzyme related to lactoylglutathione lyase
MNRMVHFELCVNDPERAAAFYEQAFGWHIVKWEGPIDYWFVKTGDPAAKGINGAILRSNDGKIQTINTVEVPSIEEARSSIVEHGGRALSDTEEIPGAGLFFYAEDPAGIKLGIIQYIA